MAVVYVEGRFQIHGLELRTEKQLNDLIKCMEEAMREAHPSLRFDNDIDLDVDTKAGNFEN